MRFFLGDDNGQLKSVRCTKPPETDWRVDISLLDDGGMQGKSRAVQRLAVQCDKVVVARGDGSATMFVVEEHADSAQLIQQWQETRFKSARKYVGLGLTTDSRAISCTDAGHLRLTHINISSEDAAGSSSQTTSIPNRLCEWILSDDAHSFAYGGDEVELSVWDTSRAFESSRRLLPSAIATKRKKGKNPQLIDGEIWRAKNVSNDFLNLRQPVHNTSLAYLYPMSSGAGSSHHILAGTRLGSVRRYDTRAASKPVADWKDVGKVGGIQKVQRGNSEHEAFIADHGSNLVALDLRTGRVLYSYNGLAGAISSLSPTVSSLSPPLLASTSLDRFFRLHRTDNNTKGEVLAKVWVKSAAGCVIWDGHAPIAPPEFDGAADEDEDELDIWARMEGVGEEDGTSTSDNASDDESWERKSKTRKTR